jgi:hypothetical protein
LFRIRPQSRHEPIRFRLPHRAGITGALVGWLCGIVIHALFFSSPDFRLGPSLVVLIVVLAGAATGTVVGRVLSATTQKGALTLRAAGLGGSTGVIAGILTGALVGAIIGFGGSNLGGTPGSAGYVPVILAVLFGPLCGATGVVIGLLLGLWATVTRNCRTPFQ